ncbi:MAG: hypothetical protein IJ884_02275, partial [Bacteroidales bacterium]|nr:hypothetical protein [Bacteroidales bacterium]
QGLRHQAHRREHLPERLRQRCEGREPAQGRARRRHRRLLPASHRPQHLPHIDVFLDNGYTKEEMKMVNETHKILRDDSIAVTATTVRVPVWGGHSESVNVEFRKPFDLDEARALMAAMPGVVIQDDPENKVYPMPRFAEGKDEVFVGRIRRDFSVENGLNLWCVADNLRKGAATNAVQIAQLLLEKGLLAE